SPATPTDHRPRTTAPPTRTGRAPIVEPAAAEHPRPVLTAATVLPEDADRAALVARVHDPEYGGPCVAAVRGAHVGDLTAVAAADGGRVWRLDDLLAAPPGRADVPHLLAPVDLQVIKAAGVTFARSLLERVIEERTGGDPAQAARVRARVGEVVGGTLDGVRPGTPQAARAKDLL